MAKKNESEAHTVTYYGKKRYRLNPRLVPKTETHEKTPNYYDVDSENSSPDLMQR